MDFVKTEESNAILTKMDKACFSNYILIIKSLVTI